MISGRDEIFTKNIEEPWLYCYDILYLDYLYIGIMKMKNLKIKGCS